MDLYFLTLLLLGAIAGGFANGLTGFGTAIFALGFWLQIMTPTQAVATVVVMAVFSGFQGLFAVRKHILEQPFRLLRFLIPGLIGVPIGTSILYAIDPFLLKLAIATFLIVYSGFFLLKSNLPKLHGSFALVDIIVGFLSGILGGLASTSGVLPTIWATIRPWDKGETRAVLQSFNFSILGFTAVVLAFGGAYSKENFMILAITLPVSAISAFVGIKVFRAISDDTYKKLLIILMFISGFAILAKELIV